MSKITFFIETVSPILFHSDSLQKHKSVRTLLELLLPISERKRVFLKSEYTFRWSKSSPRLAAGEVRRKPNIRPGLTSKTSWLWILRERVRWDLRAIILPIEVQRAEILRLLELFRRGRGEKSEEKRPSYFKCQRKCLGEQFGSYWFWSCNHS